MENKDKPAFAAGAMTDSGAGFHETGLTKREYFAAMAMQGILSNPIHAPQINNSEATARIAIGHADELLKQLDTSNQPKKQ